jgi:hypothetical protein
MKNPSLDSRSTADVELGLPEYETGLLTTGPQCSVYRQAGRLKGWTIQCVGRLID